MGSSLRYVGTGDKDRNGWDLSDKTLTLRVLIGLCIGTWTFTSTRVKLFHLVRATLCLLRSSTSFFSIVLLHVAIVNSYCVLRNQSIESVSGSSRYVRFCDFVFTLSDGSPRRRTGLFFLP